MKDIVRIWDKVTGKQYASVNTNDKELRELPNNRLKINDVDTSNFEQNLSECEGLNKKFDETDFQERKDAIINRLFERRKKGHLTRQPKCLFILLVLGFCTLGAGFFVMFLHPYDFFFAQKVVLKDGGEIFEMWRKPEVQLYVKIFLFNITNAEEYMSGQDDKIHVQEIGPYVYRELFEHKVNEFNPNGTLSATPVHPLIWEEELSEGNREDDIVYLPHIALLSIANVVAQQGFMARFGLNNVIRLTNSKPLAKMTAGEFMMGYESKLMTLGNTFLPGWIYFDKLGLIDRMYDFNGDYETIFTGETDVTLAGLIDTYKGSTDLPQWNDKHCSNVQYASDGAKFKGGLGRNETISFYRKSLCRSAPLVPTGEGIKSGLPGYLYTLPEHLLDNGKYIEENKCFCRNGKCLPEGLIDVTDCYYGFPIALSYPHFYKGDEILFEKVEGLNPNKEAHETRFWIEPQSGLPLDVSAKFQINMALNDLSSIANAERFSNMYLPMLWFDIRLYSLPLPMEQRFKLYLRVLPTLEQSIMYLCFCVGICLILLSVYRLTFKVMFKNVTGKKQRNFAIGTGFWKDKEKHKTKEKDLIYAPCEIPLSETEYDIADDFHDSKPSILKIHTEKIKELSSILTDKVYDSVENVKGKVREELTHVKNIFKDDKRDSALDDDEYVINEAYKSDSSDDNVRGFKAKYEAIQQLDSDDDCKYLEVVEDNAVFDHLSKPMHASNRSKHLQALDSQTANNDMILYISD